MRSSDWSSDVCSSDLQGRAGGMRIAFALAAAAIAVGPAFAAPPHYKVAAHFDPQGEVDADVTITLSEGETEKAFLLSRRFAVEPKIGRASWRERVCQYV